MDVGVAFSFCRVATHTVKECKLSFVKFQVRLMMKAHSFIRENVPRVLTWAKDKTSM